MGLKAEKTQKHIIARAREIFARKGFKNVTMQDIVDACDISRGGLYLHFASVEEVFLAVLKAEGEEATESEAAEDDTSSEGTADEEAVSSFIEVTGELSASDRLAAYLKEQKIQILRRKDSLSLAVMEYYSEHKDDEGDNYLRNNFDSIVENVSRIIYDGVSSGEFECDDIYGCARNLAYVLEGLKMMAGASGVSEHMVDREMVYILQGLVPAEQYTN